jgi:hypothetical protein
MNYKLGSVTTTGPLLFIIVLMTTRMNVGLHVPQKEKAHYSGLSRYLIKTDISKGSV